MVSPRASARACLVHEAVDRGRGVDEIVAGVTQGGPQVHGVVGEDPPGLGLRLGGLALEAVGAETGRLLVHVLVLVRDRLERVPGVVQGRAAPGQDIIESRHRISETFRHGQSRGGVGVEGEPRALPSAGPSAVGPSESVVAEPRDVGGGRLVGGGDASRGVVDARGVVGEPG